METLKLCKICNTEKPINHFHRDKKMLYGVGNRCKLCRREGSIKNYNTTAIEYKIYHRAKSRAKRKKLDFNIKLEDIVIPKYCPVFNTEMRVPSIDRINSFKGYVKGNIQIISNRANMLKNNASIRELELILEFMKRNRQCEVK